MSKTNIEDILKEYARPQSPYSPVNNYRYENPEIERILSDTRKSYGPNEQFSFQPQPSGQGVLRSIITNEAPPVSYTTETLKRSGVGIRNSYVNEAPIYRTEYPTTTEIRRSVLAAPNEYQEIVKRSGAPRQSVTRLESVPTQVIYERAAPANYDVKPYDYRTWEPSNYNHSSQPQPYVIREPTYVMQRPMETEVVKRAAPPVAPPVVMVAPISTAAEDQKIRVLTDEVDRQRNQNSLNYNKFNELQNEKNNLKGNLTNLENELNNELKNRPGEASEALKKSLEDKDREIALLRANGMGRGNKDEIENLMTGIKNKEYENEQLRGKIEDLEIQTRNLKTQYSKGRDSRVRKGNTCC